MSTGIISVTDILVGPILPAANRFETDERWAAALARAQAGVQLFEAGDRFYATSQADKAIAYEVTSTTCGCMAGRRGDAVCCHRAALRSALWISPFGPLSPR